MQHHHTFSPLVAAPAGTARDAERRHPGWTWLFFRFLGALAVLGVGAVHLEAYTGPYSAIPTIGTLFLVNFVTATVIGLVLLAPLEHVAGAWAGAAVVLVTAAGMAVAGVSYVMLYISERTPLFGFQKPGYDRAAISASRWLELAAFALLGISLLLRFAARSPARRW
jgi:hypothetical protein